MSEAANTLLTEHFRYTPLSLIDDIINAINNLIYQGISSLETGLHATPPPKLGFKHAANSIPDTDGDGNEQFPEAHLEIENGLHQLETLLESTVDKTFDKLEIYVLRNILTVPEDLVDWVWLGHYEGLSFESSPDDPTPESIETLRKQLNETRKLNRNLNAEVARNNLMISQLQSLLSNPSDQQKPPSDPTQPNLAFLTTTPSAQALNVGTASQPPLTTNTTFALSQLPALRAVLQSLRPKMNALASNKVRLDPKMEERRAYIEGRTRVHLERNGEIGGEIGGMEGRRVERGEVEALERIVEGMEGVEK